MCIFIYMHTVQPGGYSITKCCSMMCGWIQAADSAVLVSHPDLTQLTQGEGSGVTSPNSKSLGLWKYSGMSVIRTSDIRTRRSTERPSNYCFLINAHIP